MKNLSKLTCKKFMGFKKKPSHFFNGLIFCFFLLSCVSYNSRVLQSNRLLYKGEVLKAASVIEEVSKEPGKNQLAYLLDYATLLQIAGQYKKSSDFFLKAEKIAEVKDYHSLSRIAGSILLNEAQMQYKGEDYEKLLIHVMLAINFLLLENKEAALVETRKLNEKLHHYKHEAKKDYEQNVFAYYLAGLIWESDKKWEDAYLDYQAAYKLNPGISYLKEDLVRLSSLARHPEAHTQWKKKFNILFKKEWKDPSYGELVLIFQQGRGPIKKPHPDFDRIPKLFPSYSHIKKFLVQVFNEKEVKTLNFQKEKLDQGKELLILLKKDTPVVSNRNQESKGVSGVEKEVKDDNVKQGEQMQEKEEKDRKIHEMQSSVIYSVEDVAIKTLNDKYKALIAKRIAGIVAKELVAHQVRKENEALGDLMRLTLHLLDRPDLRQWTNLPETFQLVRVFLKEGIYRLKVSGMNKKGEEVLAKNFEKTVSISRGKKHFHVWRSFY